MISGTSVRWRATPGRAAALTLLLVIFCAALGFAAATVLATTYSARSSVLVMPLEGNPFNPTGNGDDLNNLQSEAQLAQSDAVATLVSGSGAGDASRLTVTVPPNTQLLEFSYEATDPLDARTGAQAFASAYLAFRSTRNDQAVVAQARAIQDEIETQSDRIDDLAQQKGGVESAEQRAAIQQQMNAISSQVVQLSTTLSAVTTVDRDPGQIVTVGHLVGRSPGATRLLFSLAGAVLGLAAGSALLVLTVLSRIDGAVEGVDEAPPVRPTVRSPGPERGDAPAEQAEPTEPTAGNRELVGRGNAE